MDPIDKQNYLLYHYGEQIGSARMSLEKSVRLLNLFESEKEIKEIRNRLFKKYAEKPFAIFLQHYTFSIFSRQTSNLGHRKTLIESVDRLIQNTLSPEYLLDPLPESIKIFFPENFGGDIHAGSFKTVGMLPSERPFLHAYSSHSKRKERCFFALKVFQIALKMNNTVVFRSILKTHELQIEKLHIYFLEAIIKEESCPFLMEYLRSSPFRPEMDLISGLFPKAVQSKCHALVCDMMREGVNLDTRDEEGKTALHYCVETDDFLTAELLLRQGVNDGIPPFLLAVQKEKWEVAELIYTSLPAYLQSAYIEEGMTIACYRQDFVSVMNFIRRGLKPNFITRNGMTPLGIACHIGRRDLVTILIDSGADPAMPDQEGMRPWEHAFFQEDDELVFFLLQNGGYIDLYSKSEAGVRTPLHAYMMNGLVSRMVQLIANGANIDLPLILDKNISPLQWALLNKEWKIANFLLENGADIHAGDPISHPVKLALRGDRSDLFSQLVMIGGVPSLAFEDFEHLTTSDVFKRLNGWKLFLKIAGPHIEALIPHYLHHRRFDLVDYLLQFNGISNVKNRYGENFLHLVCEMGLDSLFYRTNLSLFELDDPNGNGETAMALAFKHGYQKIGESLFHHGAALTEDLWLIAVATENQQLLKLMSNSDIPCTFQNALGYTPLHFACQKNQSGTVELLIHSGAELHAKCQKGDTALHKAAIYGDTKILHFLLCYGAEIDAENKNGITPLIAAILSGRMANAEFLVKAGANINHSGKFPGQVLASACERGNGDMINFLLRQGARADLLCKVAHVPGMYGKTADVRRGMSAIDGNLTATLEIINHLSHRFAVPIKVDYQGSSGQVEGALAHYSIQSLQASLNAFFRKSPLSHLFSEEEKWKIDGLFETMVSPMNARLRAQRLTSGDMVCIPSGYRGHTIGLLFFRTRYPTAYHMIESNRGAKTEHYGLKMKKLCNHARIPLVIDKLHQFKLNNRIDSKTYREVLAELDLSEKPNESYPVFDHIPQQGPFCTHTNLKPLIPEAAVFALFLQRGEGFTEAKRKARMFYKSFTAFDRNYILDQFNGFIERTVLPKGLKISLRSLKQIYKKMKDDPRFNQGHVNKFERICNMLNARSQLI